MREARHTEIPWVQHHLLSIQKRPLSLCLSRSHSSSLYLFCPPDPPFIFSHWLSLSIYPPAYFILSSNSYLPVNAHVCIEGGTMLDLLRLFLLLVFGIILSTVRRGRKRAIRSHKINRETDFWWACVLVSVCVWECTRVCVHVDSSRSFQGCRIPPGAGPDQAQFCWLLTEMQRMC